MLSQREYRAVRCPDENELARLLAGGLNEREAQAIEEHVDACSICGEVLAALARSLDTPDTEGEGLGVADQVAGPLAPGDEVDHFRVLRLLGRGGMGEVHLARDTRLGRRVALKVLRPEKLGLARDVERFLFEARTTARFSHPHIVTVYHVGEHRGSPYLALEYLDGETLRRRLADGVPSYAEALRTALAISEALAEAHRHRVLHRDLKPENVVICKDGRLRVVDFGLARVLGPREMSEPGTFFGAGGAEPSAPFASHGPGLRGTPAYMAPEQWTGGECTEATDIWALGVLTHELATGRRPHSSRTVDGLRAEVISRGGASISMEGFGPRTELGELVARCLAARPMDRPSASEMAERLSELLSGAARGAPVDATPFRGLLSFAEEHAPHFYGRDAEIACCLERLRSEPLLALLGPSGAGKSSFVAAGVIPRLREQGNWLVFQLRPGHQPFRALLASLGTDAAEADELGERLRESPQVLNLHLRELAARRRASVLLFVDQLEELCTLVADGEGRRTFLRALCAAADEPSDPVRVILALREDFLSTLAQTPEVRQALSRVMVLGSLGPDALRETISRPVNSAGYAFDDEKLVGEMVEAVKEEAAALPLLQFAASRLWEARDQQRRLLLRAAHEAMGGVAGALARHADQVLEGFSADQVREARQLLLRLVTAERTRRVLSEAELRAGLGTSGEDVLRRLIAARLLTARQPHEQTDEPEVELAHESLITRWGRLSRWIDETREELGVLAEVSQAAALWHKRGRCDADLWQGDALAEAQRIRRRGTMRAPELASLFLEASQRRALRRARRRRLLQLAVLLLVVGVALFLARQERQARRHQAWAEHQRARAELEAAASSIGQGDPQQARARVRASLEIEDSTLARGLWWWLSREPLRWTHSVSGYMTSLAVAPDGSSLAVGSTERAAYLVDRLTGSEREVLRHRDQVHALGWSPDGRRLVTGSFSGEVRVFSLIDGGSRALSGPRAAVTALAFSPDGTRLVVGDRSGSLYVWDGDEERGRRWRGGLARVNDLCHSPDGKWLAVAAAESAVVLWPLKSAGPPVQLTGHNGQVRAVACSADAKLLATGGSDGAVRLWDFARPSSGRLIEQLPAAVVGVALSTDGTLLAVAGMDRSIHVRRLDRSEHWLLRTPRASPILSSSVLLRFVPQRHLLLSGSERELQLWDADVPRPAEERAPIDAVSGLAFPPDGRVLASGHEDGSIRLQEVATGHEVGALHAKTEGYSPVAISPDGRLLASEGPSGSIYLWDAIGQGQPRVLQGHSATVVDLCFSHDGELLASASRDLTAALWRVADGERRAVLSGHADLLKGVAFSTDDRLIATSSADRTIRLWETRSGSLRRVLSGHLGAVFGVAFSADGEKLYSGSEDRTVREWQVGSGTSRVLARYDERVYWIGLSPDGERLGVPLASGLAYVMDLRRGTSAVLRGHRSEVNTIRFNAAGTRVATGADDGSVRLWDSATGVPLWRAPLLGGWPTPQLYSHLGRIRLDLTEAARPTPGNALAPWERQVLDRARVAAVAPETSSLCLATPDEELEIWDTAQNRRLTRRLVRGIRRVVALPRACVTLADSQVVLHPRDGAPRVLVSDRALAVNWTGAELLAATDRQLSLFSSEGAPRERLTIDQGATSVARAGEELLVGYREGGVGRLSLVEKKERELSYYDHPASAVEQLLPGPGGTLIVGYASGTVGIWDLASGKRLGLSTLRGPVAHLLLRNGRLYAASELGDHLVWDLRPLEQPSADLLREVRRER